MSKKYIYSFFLLLLIMIVIFSPAKALFRSTAMKIFSVPARVLHSAGYKVGSLFSSINNISNLQKENSELADKIMSLEVDLSKISELEHENQLLKNELGYVQQNPNESLLPARIIFRDPTSYFETMKVDKGERDGVKIGQAVLSGGALVGQITEVHDSESGVTLITSKDSIILATLQNSRANGALRGGISGLVLEDISQDVEYQDGEYIITSGLDETLKPGVLIGRANGIQTLRSSLFRNINVDPIVDLSKLELVFIVQ